MIAGAAILLSSLAFIAWRTGDQTLASWIVGATSMKLPSALAIIACSVSVLFTVIESRAHPLVGYSIPGSAMLASMVMLSALSEYWRTPNVPQSAYAAQVPSLGTACCVFLFTAAMIYRTIAAGHGIRCIVSRVCGMLIVNLSLCVILGYALDLPALTWEIHAVSSPVALPTAVAFLLLGSTLLTLPGSRLEDSP